MPSETVFPSIGPALSAAEAAEDRTPQPARAWANHTHPGAIESTTLLRGGKSVAISHNGTTYRLQATRQGKLILTK